MGNLLNLCLWALPLPELSTLMSFSNSQKKASRATQPQSMWTPRPPEQHKQSRTQPGHSGSGWLRVRKPFLPGRKKPVPSNLVLSAALDDSAMRPEGLAGKGQ